MRLFDHLRGRAKTAGPQEAAEELYAYSRLDLNAEILPEGVARCRPSINANYKFTKTAITLQWLQKMERLPSGAANAGAVIEEFEKLTFGGFEPDTASSLVEHLRKIMEITNLIDVFMSNQTIPKEKIDRAGLQIAQRWFEIALDDPDLVVRATVTHGGEIIYAIHQEMKNIGEMVVASVLGGGRS